MKEKMASRKTFIWYIDRVDYVEAMTNEELWILFRKILQHVAEIEETELPPEIKIIRAKVKKQLDEDKYKWEAIVESKSKAWSNHTWNQYTRQREERNRLKEAKKSSMEQMEQNGTNGTHLICNNNISSSKKKEERNIKKEEMLEAYRSNVKINSVYKEEDVEMWLDYKIDKKQPYKNARSFCTYLVSVKKEISFWQVRLDLDKRFSYAVDIAIAKGWDWIHWPDWMEKNYLMSKRDLYPTQKQNE